MQPDLGHWVKDKDTLEIFEIVSIVIQAGSGPDMCKMRYRIPQRVGYRMEPINVVKLYFERCELAEILYEPKI